MYMEWKNILLLCLSAFFFSNGASAKIWRVNNNPLAGADFLDIQSAVNTANPSDTIQVEGSDAVYPAFICQKRLIFIGPGYLLSLNPQTQAIPMSAKIAGATFVNQMIQPPGSQGSVIMGMEFRGDCVINAPAITVTRNYFPGVNTASIAIGIERYPNYGDIKITQNFMPGNSIFRHGTNQPVPFPAALLTNFTISNNICDTISVTPFNSQSNGLISNNILYQAFANNSVLVNNIFLSTAYLTGPFEGLTIFNNGSATISGGFEEGFYLIGNNNTILNNIFGSPSELQSRGFTNFTLAQFSLGGGNIGIWYPDFSQATEFNQFVSSTSTSPASTTPAFIPAMFKKFIPGPPPNFTADSGAVLNTGSIAIGVGLNGFDCGAFGGPGPYVLSGMPPVPSIYTLVVPSPASGSSLLVTFSVTSHQ
jgi:hypothetical protein